MRLLVSAIGFALTYVSGSAAIHTGRWFFYFLTFALAYLSIRLLIGVLRRGKE